MLFDFDRPDYARLKRTWPNAGAGRFVEVSGLRWYVQDLGTGPVVVLVHGTAGATHSWRDVAPALAAKGFRVIAPDLPSHGFTGEVPSGELTLPAMARALSGLLKALDVAPVVVVGHSAGAAILIRAAIDGGIKPKVTIGLNAALLPFQGLAQQLFPTLARLLVLNPVVPRLFSWTTGRDGVQRLIEKTGSTIDRRGLDCYAELIGTSGHVAGALGMMARWELEPLVADLKRLTTRLDLVVGMNDLAVPPDNAEAIVRAAPETRLFKLPGLGHLAHEEDPGGAAALIAEAAMSGWFRLASFE